MRFAVEPLRRAKIRLLYYLDDYRILAQFKPELRILDKPPEKLFNTTTVTELFGLYLQHKHNNADLNTEQKDYWPHQADQTSATTNHHQIMPMDSQPFGENDSTFTSNWGSTTTHTPHATGFSQELTHSPQQRECNLSVVSFQPVRTGMVADPSLKYATKSGGTSSSIHLQDLAIKIQKVTNKHNLTVSYYQHIAGVDNIQADKLSRTTGSNTLHKATIPTPVFSHLNAQWGPFNIDCQLHGCLPTTLAEDRLMPLPTMEAHFSSLTPIETTIDHGYHTDYTNVDNPTLVANAPSIRPPSTATGIQDTTIVHDRLAVIQQAYKNQGLSDESCKYLTADTIRGQTSKAYNHHWNQFTDWCLAQQSVVHPLDDNPITVHNCLMSINHLATSNLYGRRSAIASVYKIIHPHKGPLAEEPMIVDFFKAKRNNTVIIPAEHQLETWDTDQLLNHLLIKWLSSERLSLEALQQKTPVFLLCMGTMGRPRSDIGVAPGNSERAFYTA
ncbi:hypothetical protein, partial, partial [Parasitella parasitica]